MLNAQNVYEIAKKYQAEIIADRQIQWHDTANSCGEWRQSVQYHPSVMDVVILERAPNVPGYLEAANEATGWPEPAILGFLQTMILGKPIESEEMHMTHFMHWKGVIIALMVIAKLKSRLEEAEDLFR